MDKIIKCEARCFINKKNQNGIVVSRAISRVMARENSRQRSLVATLAATFSGLVAMLSSSLLLAQGEVSFDWSMPDRLLENKSFAAYDANSPIPQYDPNVLMLPSDGWLVNFDACAISTAANIVNYRWLIDDVAVATVADCTFAHKFPTEGVYQVSLEATDDVASTQILNQEIIVQDWLIIALGDSYGSGEGNPVIAVTEKAHKEVGVLHDRLTNINAEIQSALQRIPELEQEQQQKQQLIADLLLARDRAASELSTLKSEQRRLLEIKSKAENDPALKDVQNNIKTSQRTVDDWQKKVNSDQKSLNNCVGLISCESKKSILTASKKSLATAKSNLNTAKTDLQKARDTAVEIHSGSSGLQSVSQLSSALSAKASAVGNAQGVLSAAEKKHKEATNTLQQLSTELKGLQESRPDQQAALQTAKDDLKAGYLTTLAVWTEIPPSWGGVEPRFNEVVFNQQIPGDAQRCHRSMISGQARAALALEQADPHTSVTLVHLSCSGATIDNGLVNGAEGQSMSPVLKLLRDEGVLPGQTLEAGLPHLANLPKLESQVKAAAAVVAGREVDAIVISIGGNDVKFTDLIVDCITSEPCHTDIGTLPSQEFLQAQQIAVEQNCNPGAFINQIIGSDLPSANISFNESCLSLYDSPTQTGGVALATYNGSFSAADGSFVLDRRLSVLNTEITNYFPALKTSRVYLTEYIDPTADDSGNYCGWNPAQASTAGEELKNLPGVTSAEMTWADQTVAAAIKNATESAVALNQWSLISETGENTETIRSVSRNHGYCADDNWIVTMPESFLTQRDQLGAVHPNRDGHEVYKQAIYTSLAQDFYPAGSGQAPRAPDTGQATPAVDDGSKNNNSLNVGSSASSITLLFILLLSLSIGRYLSHCIAERTSDRQRLKS